MSKRIVVLTAGEIALLDEQDPSTVRDGGFQGFIVGLQQKLRRGTSEIILDDEDQENIARYAFDFKQGGWQTRLVKIFGRELGQQLGRESQSGLSGTDRISSQPTHPTNRKGNDAR